MPIILDIAGKPLPPRNRAKKRLRAQDFRDLLKVLIVLSLVIMGYLFFAPDDGPQRAAEAAPAQTARAG